MKQIPLPIGFVAARTFENFLPGANAAALAHLQSPGATPVYLWGPPGSGKSHLLQAAAHRIVADGLRTGWFSAEVAAPWIHDEAWQMIVIDDCDALDDAQQQSAFGLFIQAAADGQSLLAAGRVPPVDLRLREDLRTRLGWGHIHALRPLAEPEVRAALRREADRRGVFLSDEVMDYLLTHFARDLKHLMAQLDRLDAFALASKRAVTVPLLRLMLTEEGGMP